MPRLKDQRLAKSFHQRVGFLFQNSDAQLFCTTVYDEIAFGLVRWGCLNRRSRSV